MGLRDGLVGAWCPSLGPTASTLLDRSGRNTHGTLVNMDQSTDWVQSGGAGALDFDATDDRVSIPVAPVVAAPFTISAWVNIASVAGNKTVVTLHSSGTQRFVLYITSDRRPAFFVNDAGGFSQADAGQVVTANNWFHVVAVEASATSHRVIYNASAEGLSVVSRTPAGVSGCQIGADLSSGTPQSLMNGRLDDIAIWNRALTATEIRQLYTQGRGAWLRQTRRRTFGYVPPTFRAAWVQRSKLIGGGV